MLLAAFAVVEFRQALSTIWDRQAGGVSLLERLRRSTTTQRR